ncbi:MAG: 30S ribosomal protein S3 [Planctomycetota bacterium]|jgi:small subunit ribosomal protein S3|nr:30S ribosomal protein S3 [Planctomycetota bacterium]MDP6990102.1 30S ribosomal protein S3 [Planctomycetota bacterium]
MGQKVHPTGYRIGTIEPWRSRWYANKKDFGRLLLQDKEIRDHIEKEFSSAGIPRIEIERSGETINVIIYTARPGVLVGRKGVRVEQLKKELQGITGSECHLTLHEVKRPELEAKLVAEVVAEALEKRMNFRRAIKRAIQTTMQSGAQGVKVEVAGRLGGAEMARRNKEREGRVPLSTLQAHVDYGTARARTSYGIIGVKVWIYKGDVERGKLIDFRQQQSMTAHADRPRFGRGRGEGRPRREG